MLILQRRTDEYYADRETYERFQRLLVKLGSVEMSGIQGPFIVERVQMIESEFGGRYVRFEVAYLHSDQKSA